MLSIIITCDLGSSRHLVVIRRRKDEWVVMRWSRSGADCISCSKSAQQHSNTCCILYSNTPYIAMSYVTGEILFEFNESTAIHQYIILYLPILSYQLSIFPPILGDKLFTTISPPFHNYVIYGTYCVYHSMYLCHYVWQPLCKPYS